MGRSCNPVPRGEAGELVVRGPNITKGYWNDSEKNEEAFKCGWFHTGDMARKGKWGLLYVRHDPECPEENPEGRVRGEGGCLTTIA